MDKKSNLVVERRKLNYILFMIIFKLISVCIFNIFVAVTGLFCKRKLKVIDRYNYVSISACGLNKTNRIYMLFFSFFENKSF